MRHPTLIVALCLLFAAPAAAATQPGAVTKSSGPVEATLGWSGGELFAEQPQLIVRRDGQQVLDAAIADECAFCSNLQDPPGDALELRDLDGDKEPEVIVTTYSGGAHCCTSAVIFRWDAAGTRYRRIVGSFGDPGYTIEDLDKDGRPEFVTADDRFAYRFAAYAFSAMPPRVFAYGTDRSGKVALRDVTAAHLDLVRRDSRRLLRELPASRREGDPRGLIAAYVADEWLLGRRVPSHVFLLKALKRGDLRARPRGDTVWPSGRTYIRRLERFLALAGY